MSASIHPFRFDWAPEESRISKETVISGVSIVVEYLNNGQLSMPGDDFSDEDDSLPDEIFERFAKELPEGCKYCHVRDARETFFMESE